MSADYVLFNRAIERGNYPSLQWLEKHINVAYATKKLTDDEFMDLLIRIINIGGDE